MYKLAKKILAGLSLSACFFLSAPQAFAMPEIMPLAEVTEGMTGIAYTVVDSSRALTSFDVRIIGTVAGGKGDLRYIMAEASGPLVEETRGIIHGMSGSPVYIDGRLIGAASASYPNVEHRIFLITPIEDMLPLWDFPDTKHIIKSNLIDLKALAEERAKKEAAEAEKAEKAAAKEAAEAAKEKPEELKDTAKKKEKKARKAKAAEAEIKENEPKPEEAKAEEVKAEEIKAEESKPENEEAAKDNAPQPEAAKAAEPKMVLSAAGFGNAGLTYLQSKMAPLGYKAELGLGSNTVVETEYNAELEAGSSVGATLICGDFTLGATGTVTAVDDKKILAFGHSFLHRGNVNYFMMDTNVIGTVSSMTDGKKIANMGNIIGRINQDRGTGIAGILGVFPSIVPITVNVEDSTLGRKEIFRAKAAYDEEALTAILPSVGYAALTRTVDNLACSTVKTHFVIKTNALEKGTVEHTNMYYADADAGQNAFNELQNALSLIVGDTEKQADIYSVKLDIAAVAERKTASIVSAVPDRMNVKPGETVNFKIKLKPYRAENVTVEMPYTVPKSRYEGPLTLDFHGGGLVSIGQLLAALQGAVDSIDADKVISTAEKLDNLEKAAANNEIVIEIGQPPIMSEKEQEKMIKRAIKAAKAAQAQEKAEEEEAEENEPPRLATDYIIDNVAHATLQVEKP